PTPVVAYLNQGLTCMPPEIVREDHGDDAPEIARMVPELRRRFPDIGEPLELPPEQQRRYFFNAVGSFIARGSTRFPLLLVMDDVHWADEPTLLLIEHMAALMPELRVLGVGTYRDVELDVARPLAATLERLVRARTVERLSVKRFDRGGVALMLDALAGKAPPESIVGAVFEETEGNPFFVEEVFRHLAEEGKVFDESGDFRTDIEVDELDVPESVRLVVNACICPSPTPSSRRTGLRPPRARRRSRTTCSKPVRVRRPIARSAISSAPRTAPWRPPRSRMRCGRSTMPCRSSTRMTSAAGGSCSSARAGPCAPSAISRSASQSGRTSSRCTSRSATSRPRPSCAGRWDT